MCGLKDARRNLLRALLVLGVSLPGAGCQTFTGEPPRLYTLDEEAAMAREDALPMILAAYNGATADRDRMSFRNEYIARRMYIIDVEFTDFESALTRENQEFGFGTALTAQGLSTAGALFTPASTVRTLSGLASGVNAARGFYDSELLASKTIQIVESQMQASRDDVATRIVGRLTESTLTYPLSAALHDLEDYFRAGTLTAGLIKATAKAGIDAENSATAKVAAIRLQARSGIIADVKQPMVAQSQFVLSGPTRLTSFEQHLTPAQIARIQAALCVAPPATDFGLIGSPPRLAMQQFFTGAGVAPDQMINSTAQLNLLLAAVASSRHRTGGSCDPLAVGRSVAGR